MSEVRERKKKYNILYVDDEAANLRVFKSVFKRDYKVFIAEGGAQALEIMKENDIHLLVTDQRMPGMSGVELLESVVSDFPDMVKMILSGFSDVEDIIKAVNECGLDQYLMKPWNKEDLGETFNKALAKFESDEDKNEVHIIKKALEENEKYAHKQIHALLPKQSDLDSFFEESFTLYKPMNDLGGVFYWFGTTDDNKGILASIDCAETGVKGALLTMLFETALKGVVYKKKVTTADGILASLDEHFQESSDEEQIGYNVGITVIDKDSKFISFAGAGQNMHYIDGNNDLEMASGDPVQIGVGDTGKKFDTFQGTFDEVRAVYLYGTRTGDQFSNAQRVNSLEEMIDEVMNDAFAEQKEELMVKLAESISGQPQEHDVMILGAKI
ncbi:MAG: response regulator [bacterium]|nr:response regulator [bacterium]